MTFICEYISVALLPHAQEWTVLAGFYNTLINSLTITDVAFIDVLHISISL